MAATGSVRTDETRLSRIDQYLFKIETIFCLISGLAVFSLMVLAVISVTGRHLFNQPLSGYVDWIEIIMPVIAFLGISYSQRLGGHIRMDILIMNLKGRPLWITELISTIIILLLVLLLLWGSWAHFLRSFDFSAPLWSRDSSVDIGLPIWPAKLIVPLAFSVLGMRLCLQIWGYARAIYTGAHEPVAVPLPEDAAAMAAAEASAVSD
ncbi:MAG: TRAP transporter small permease subunit [Rhodomicrobiaceae bacterium]|jgi:TRAP-type C4-dicarboxylate transport system permease small subunit